jgi:hypothetical protein
MEAVTALAPQARVMAAACAAVGLARATFHRHRHAAKRPALPARPRTKPARTLTAHERQSVLVRMSKVFDVKRWKNDQGIRCFMKRSHQ